jgi:diguanylate cyclase (GGDEF)-like protein/PAS domain S-box-containing protein
MIALLYVLLGGFWILLSSLAVSELAPDRDALHLAESLKGMLFVGATGAGLYLLLRHWQRQARHAETVFATTREGIVVTAADGRIESVNPAFTTITGYQRDEVRGHPAAMLGALWSPDDAASATQRALAQDGTWCGEIWGRRKNGEAFPQLLSVTAVRGKRGRTTHFVWVFADLTQLRASQRERDYLAHHDPLTGLPNRATLAAALAAAIDTAQREQLHCAVLMLNVDRFQDINDSYGHAIGDSLLMQVATRLRAAVRPGDSVLRLGGDEFLVVLERLKAGADAGRVAAKLLHDLQGAWRTPDGDELRMTGSIGISVLPTHGTRPEQLLQHADAALHAAKQEGRGNFRFFSEGLTRAARERLETESRLHQALVQGDLRLHFQPQVKVSSGAIVGAEALVRWSDPQRGLVAPDRFIPVAEACGLIDEVGRWVLETTCSYGRAWLDAGMAPLTLAVNLSPHQFRCQDVRALVETTLAKTGFPPHLLELELTESALLEQGERAASVLAGLRALGVRVAIDDFGTGYSSLAHLKRFQVDVLKIDRSFVTELPDGQDDAAIATAIVRMGHSLGFEVVAEGVETDAQLGFLRELGCDQYQGYLCSPALPAEEFAALVSSSAPSHGSGGTGAVTRKSHAARAAGTSGRPVAP